MNKLEAIPKKTFKKAKNDSWINFTNSINFRTPFSQIWKKNKRFRHRKLVDLSVHPQNTSTEEKMVGFIPSICPPSCHFPNFPNIFFSNTQLDSSFSLSALNLAISLGKTSSAPGLDKIDFNIISHLPESIRSLLVSSFNSFFQDGPFPPSWKEFLVFFIPKCVPGKFRPISLASCFLKLMERLLHFWIVQWLEKQGLLPASQFGFRKSRLCCDNLSILTTEIYTGFVENEYTSSIVLDISSAFDNVNLTSLLMILRFRPTLEVL